MARISKASVGLPALLLVLLLTACVNPSTRVRPERGSQDSRRPPASAPVSSGPRYEVQAGDTLFRIAFRHQVSVDELVEWNGIVDRNKIFVGQQLRVGPAHVERAPETVASAPVTSGLPEPEAEPIASVPQPSQTDPQTGVVTSAVTTPAAPEGGLVVSEPEPVPLSGRTPVASTSTAPAPQMTATTPVEATPEPDEATMPAPSTAAVIPTPGSAMTSGAAPTAVRNGWSWPLAGRLVGSFVAGDATRSGLDISGNEGQAVYAAADGEVVYSGTGILGYGELIVIQHQGGLLSAYGHNRKRLVAENASIKRGQQIAEMGREPSGRQVLHFEIRKNGKPVDPLAYLPGR